jgi:stage II sporulation protein D
VILEALLVFRLAGETVFPTAEAATTRPVGSLQKPWVLAAWAEAHPDETPPALACTAASGCWRPSGHGRVDLPRAFAQSCNAYFLALARATPEELRARTLSGAGFEVPRPLSPEASIGLGPLAALPRISPDRLLRSYRDLLTRPWPARDELRRALVDGMRAAALDGTGAALALRGQFVKTGTVPALDGRPNATSGWALAASAGGETLALAFLADGTGASAAAALGRELAGAGSPAAPAAARLPGPVRVRLLSALRPSRVSVANAGESPVRLRRPRAAAGWLGPGAAAVLEPGFLVGPGLLRVSAEPYGLVRFVEGTLEVSGRLDGLRLVLSGTRRAWVEGILLGELRGGSPELHEELAAAALRFLGAGPRHGRDDLCDATHCAFFAGRGPLVTWVTARRAEPSTGEWRAAAPLLDDDAWERVVALAARPGPAAFTGHCGGASLSAFQVWGRGSRETTTCPRHGPSDAEAWERLLPSSALDAVLGRVERLEAVVDGGVLKTRVTTRERTFALLYDDLHRELAPELGWDALPSPPDSFARAPGGWRARGRGRGHRVGLCLAPSFR